MHYWHVPVLEAWQHFLWASRWVGRSLILNWWIYIARAGKTLEGTGRAWGAVPGEPAVRQGRNLRAQGCLKMWFHSAFPAVAAGPEPGCLFSVEGRTVALVVLFLFPPTGGERHVFKWAGVYFHKPQAFLCGWKSCKTSESYFLWHELLCLKDVGNNFLFRLKQMKLLRCSDEMDCMKWIFLNKMLLEHVWSCELTQTELQGNKYTEIPTRKKGEFLTIWCQMCVSVEQSVFKGPLILGWGISCLVVDVRNGIVESSSLEVFKKHMEVALENRVQVLVDLKGWTWSS